jgi:hypothetical protein
MLKKTPPKYHPPVPGQINDLTKPDDKYRFFMKKMKNGWIGFAIIKVGHAGLGIEDMELGHILLDKEKARAMRDALTKMLK